MTLLTAKLSRLLGRRADASVVALHRPAAVSGVSAAGASMARLARSPWRPMIVGEALAESAAAVTPLAGAPGVCVATFPRGADAVMQVRAVRDRLREVGAGVVVPNDLPHGFVAAALDHHRGVRAAGWIHADHHDGDELVSRCGALADAWRCVSRRGRERVLRTGAPVPGSGGILSACVDVPDEPPAPVAREGPLRLLYAGRLERMNKRVLDLALLADELAALHVNFRLTIAGSGPSEGELAGLLTAHILAGRATMLGPVPLGSMSSLYAAADMLVLVSASEGMPMVVMEAMAAGRAVALTRGCGGATEAAEDGKDALIVETGDMAGMARRLAAADRPLLARMGRAAHACARERFSAAALAPRYEAFIREASRAACRASANDACGLAMQWSRILAGIEAIGPAEPGALASLALEWLADVGVRGVALHDEGSPWMDGWMDALSDSLLHLIRQIVRDDGGGDCLGWPVTTAALVPPGTPILTADAAAARAWRGQGHAAMCLRLPGNPGPAQRLFVDAVADLRHRGASRIALYGAGAHTRKLRSVLANCPEVVAIIDDRAGDGVAERLWGYPVVTPDAIDDLYVDAVIVSSDEHERQMLPKARAWAGTRMVVGLYG